MKKYVNPEVVILLRTYVGEKGLCEDFEKLTKAELDSTRVLNIVVMLDRNQWQDISINPDIPELIYHSHGSRQTRQHYQLSGPGIEVDQATANYHSPGHQHEGSQL